ncbi:hypothetical protein MMC13_007562 [Lambiella insularis]|nr:hypothetical protein [Lambiella insularis]
MASAKAEGGENPLIKALPPATDFLTYLTILEYNLTEDQLPVLHVLLQDPRLTANIGWDLVHLLVPFLPASRLCLDDIARLGNPREVILRVSELLERGKEVNGGGEESTGSEGEDDEVGQRYVEVRDDSSSTETGPTVKAVVHFQTLISMISVLHPRIQTQRPSRFLVTSLQAILPAYGRVASSGLATTAVLEFIASLLLTSRPALPPRAGDVVLGRAQSQRSAADPEGQPGALATEEDGLQVRLLRSFVTHVAEVYFESLPLIGDASGMAWTERFEEKIHPGRIVPFRKSITARFAESRDLGERDDVAQKLLQCALAKLGMRLDQVIWVATHSVNELPQRANDDSANFSPSEFPPSPRGMLYLLATATASRYLHGSTTAESAVDINMHMKLVKFSIGDEFMGSVGLEPLSLIDAVLLIGRASLLDDDNDIGTSSSENFHQYLQRMSLLSANIPSSSLRFQCHIFTSAALHAHPSDQVRYNFIRDTLEHCPFDNLKVSAIGWLKDEIVTALAIENKQLSECEEVTQATAKKASEAAKASLFARPTALRALASYLFPRVSVGEDMESLCSKMPFFLAALNFYYLLRVSRVIRDRLETDEMSEVCDIENQFINPLQAISRRLRAEMDDMRVSRMDVAGVNTDALLLEDALDRAGSAASQVNCNAAANEH